MRMKKLITVILLLAASAGAAAQTHTTPQGYTLYDNEVSLYYGQGSITQLGMALGGALGVALTFGTVSLDELRSNGTFSAGYHRHVNSWLSVGGIVGYEGISLVFSSDESSGSDGDYSFIFAMPSATAKWFSRPSWSMYSRLSAGAITGIHEGQASWGFAFQASAVGLDFGIEKVRGFLEAGLGCQGILLAGLRLCL